MFCNNCGASLNNDFAFCSNCGAPVKQNQVPQQSENQQQPYFDQQQPNLDQQPPYNQQPLYNQPPSYIEEPVQLSMNWYKFIIYFALFASAVLNTITAITSITGTIYASSGVNAKLVYSIYPGLQAVNIVNGFLLLGLAALAIITRQKLAHFKASGIILLYCVYIANVASVVIYAILNSIIIGSSTMTSRLGFQLAGNVIVILANIVYFNKRKAMFH